MLRLAACLATLLSLTAPARADLYTDLVRGSPSVQADTALEILKHPHDHSRTLLRRAIFTVTRLPNERHLQPLRHIVEDETLDTTSRAAAALALGEIGREHPDLWPPGNGEPPVHRPLPIWAQNALRGCAGAGNPLLLRQACVEALGEAGIDSVDVVQPILDDPSAEPALRIMAGRALTMMTGIPSVTTAVVTFALQTMGQP